MRNVFAAHNEWIMYVTEYSKTQSRNNAPRVILRFLPMPVGRLLVTLLVDIVPFEGYLHDTAGMVKGGTPYLFANPDYTATCFLLRQGILTSLKLSSPAALLNAWFTDI